MGSSLCAGAAVADITPKDSQFLYGYPHVERYSTGVHDPLLSSALYLSDGRLDAMFIANDIVHVAKDMVACARQRIADAVGTAPERIMITATHTHSGPIVFKAISNEADPVVPDSDPEFLRLMEDGIVKSGVEAYRAARPAQLGLALADGRGAGTNRRDPDGPADPEVPVLMVRAEDGKQNVACMLVFSMHPTVLHEDSKLVSADFPGMARQFLQKDVLGPDCPVLHHMGPAGNQSTRHVVRANTFEEAERLGRALGRAARESIGRIDYVSGIELACSRAFVELRRKTFPSLDEAEGKLSNVQTRLRDLQESGAPRATVRTAECDLFGAEETVTLARAVRDGRLEAAVRECMPAEIQAIRVGPWTYVGWQGEIFVEYSLAVKRARENTFVISCANGSLHGYIVTPEAAAEGGYEASNGLFSHESGQQYVDATLAMSDGV